MFSRLTIALAAAFCVLPFALNLWILHRYGLNVHKGDEWVIGLFLSKLVTGSISPGDLLLQANESRIALPRVILAGLAYFTSWDTRFEVLLAQIFVAVTAAILLVVSRRTLRLPWSATLLLGAVSAMLLASPAQTENLLWGIQIIVVMPALFLAAAALVATSRMPFTQQVLVQALLVVAATFSYANGMTLWVLVPLMWLGRWRDLSNRYRVRIAGIWIACALSVSWLYFSDYSSPNPASFGAAASDPLGTLRILAMWIGAPLTWGDASRAQSALALGTFTALAAVAIAIRGFWVVSDWERSAVWLALLGYGAVAGVLVAAGRFNAGASYVLTANRYIPFSAWIYIATLHLAVLAFVGASGWARRARTPLLAFVIAMLFVLYVGASHNALLRYPAIRMWDSQSRAALWLVGSVPLGRELTRITQYWNEQEPVRQLALTLSRAGLIRPRVPASAEDMAVDHAPNGPTGALESVVPTRSGQLSVSGWCEFPDSQTCAAVVLTSSTDPASFCGLLFTTTDANVPVLSALPARAAWSGEVGCANGPDLTAWAVDIDAGVLRRLRGRP